MVVPDNIKTLLKRDALFVVNHSGGKDSQAMYILLKNLIPRNQLLIIHADLPGADWPGTWEHILNTVQSGHTLKKVVAVKTFMEMVERRQMWPSPKYRQCTSDLKRGPIEKEIRHYIKETGRSGLVISCMGLRAEESTQRAKVHAFKYNKRNSKARREWYDWLPIHGLTTSQVFDTIKGANEKPHWAYEKGMSRLSCMFCIMASRKDLITAAKLSPKTYQMYCKKEREINHTFIMPTKKKGRQFLTEIYKSRSTPYAIKSDQ